MKSAHKLAASLALLVTLLVAAYFILAALQSGHSKHVQRVEVTTSPSTTSSQPSEPSVESAETSSQPAQASSPTAPPESQPPPQQQQQQMGMPAKVAGVPSEVQRPASEQPSAVRTLEVRPAQMVETTVVKQPDAVFEVVQPLEPTPRPSRPSPSEVEETSDESSLSSTTLAPNRTSEAPASSAPSVTPEEARVTNQTLNSVVQSAGGQETRSSSVSTASADGSEMTSEEREQWEAFKKRHARVFGSADEELYRSSVFVGNLRYINAFNAKSQASFQLAVNRFADMSRDEINALYIGPAVNWSQTLGKSATSPPPLHILPDQEVPADESLRWADWRNLTAGEPLDQAGCRDSSLFAVVASLEATLNAAAPAGAPRTKLSENQLIDCLAYNAPPPPAWPPVCAGHLSMVALFDFLQRQAIRLASQQEYADFRLAQAAGRAPPHTCVPPLAPQQPETRPKLASYGQVHRDNVDEALLNRGPLVVALDASQPTFHFYKSGLYHEDACSSETYNLHALLVAYAPAAPDGDTSQAHYTLRASLGPDWGERGHMRLLKDPARNKCLPQHLATYPNLAYE